MKLNKNNMKNILITLINAILIIIALGGFFLFLTLFFFGMWQIALLIYIVVGLILLKEKLENDNFFK